MTQEHIDLIQDFDRESGSGWSSDTLVQELPLIENIDSEIAAELVAIVSQSALSGNPVAITGGHGYDRKGYLSVDTLGGSRNRSYGGAQDDVLLQVTVRVPFHAVKDTVEKIQAVHLRAERAEAEEELATAEAARAEIEARIEALKERQAKLSA